MYIFRKRLKNGYILILICETVKKVFLYSKNSTFKLGQIFPEKKIQNIYKNLILGPSPSVIYGNKIQEIKLST